MSLVCNRCEGTGFLNLHQLEAGPRALLLLQVEADRDLAPVLIPWARLLGPDVQVCDCCGDGENWYGEPGEHFEGEPSGTYAYNGGLPECN